MSVFVVVARSSAEFNGPLLPLVKSSLSDFDVQFLEVRCAPLCRLVDKVAAWAKYKIGHERTHLMASRVLPGRSCVMTLHAV
jgi:hypothetical protein